MGRGLWISRGEGGGEKSVESRVKSLEDGHRAGLWGV